MALTKVTGAGLGAVTQDGAATFNEGSADVDFRVESNGNANMLFVDGGNDAVGIGNNTAASFFAGARELVVGSGTGNQGMTIFSGASNTGNIKFADATTSDATKTAGGIRYDHNSNFMRFDTNDGSERMRIRSNGAITTGTSQPDLVSSAALAQTSYTSASNWAFLYNDLRTGAGTSTIGKFYRNGSEIGSISSETNSVAYNTSSDHRLKENVTADWNATNRLKQLNPVRFNFIADADTTVDGFLAHEVQSVVPEAITGEKDAVDADGNPKYQGIDQSKLVPLLVKTIQELEARITALESA